MSFNGEAGFVRRAYLQSVVFSLFLSVWALSYSSCSRTAPSVDVVQTDTPRQETSQREPETRFEEIAELPEVSVDTSDICTADCHDRKCGPDGCGGSCGACGQQELCEDGQCVCQPDCADKECGDDGCGGSCGGCVENSQECKEGICVCKTNCASFRCDIDDGCGSICTCADDKWCSDGVCTDGNCVAIEVDRLGPGIAEVARGEEIVFAASLEHLYAYRATPDGITPWAARLQFDHKIDQIVTAKGYVFVVGSSKDTDVLFHTVKFEEPGNLTIVGELELPKSIYHAKGLEYANDHLFFLRGYQGLYSVSVESPTQPVLAGNLDGFSTTYKDVDIHDEHAFVAAEDGLYVVDVSTPSQMQVVGYVSTPHLTEVAVVGERAYVVSWDDIDQLLSIDISDEAAPGAPEPVLLEGTQSKVPLAGFGHHLVVGGHVAGGEQTEPGMGIAIWDMTNPEQPAKTSMITKSSLFSVDAAMLRLFASGNLGIQELDISSPSEPEVMAQYPVLSADALYSHDNKLYTLGSWSSNLFRFGFQSSPRLRVEWVWNLDDEESNYFLMTGLEDYLYVIGNNWDQGGANPAVSSRIGVLSVQGESAPEWVGQLDLPERVVGFAQRKPYLFLVYQAHGGSGQWDDIVGSGIYVVDASLPDSPEMIGAWHGEPISFQHIEATEDAIFLTWESPPPGSQRGITVLDSTSPTELEIVHQISSGGYYGFTNALVAVGDYLIHGVDYDTEVFDVSTPSTPLLLLTSDLQSAAATAGMSHLYLAGKTYGPMLTIVETASLPNLAPVWQSFQNGENYGTTLVLSQGHLLLKSYTKLQVFDVTGCWW